MRVKICGITNAADAAEAAQAGADAVGLNFVGGPRRIEPAIAREILGMLPPIVTPVALVRLDQAGLPGELLELFDEFRLSYLQIYDPVGQEGGLPETTLTRLAATGFRLIPVLAVKGVDIGKQLTAWGTAPPEHRPSAVVLDTYDPLCEGGTGRSFRWEWVAAARKTGAGVWPPIFLAGGLNPENVAEAIRVAAPYGVDVSSGVEMGGSPGRKDRAKMIAFVRNARAATNLL